MSHNYGHNQQSTHMDHPDYRVLTDLTYSRPLSLQPSQSVYTDTSCHGPPAQHDYSTVPGYEQQENKENFLAQATYDYTHHFVDPSDYSTVNGSMALNNASLSSYGPMPASVNYGGQHNLQAHYPSNNRPSCSSAIYEAQCHAEDFQSTSVSESQRCSRQSTRTGADRKTKPYGSPPARPHARRSRKVIKQEDPFTSATKKTLFKSETEESFGSMRTVIKNSPPATPNTADTVGVHSILLANQQHQFPMHNMPFDSALVTLETSADFQMFDKYGNEMLVSNSGRTLFPPLRYNVANLHPDKFYSFGVKFRVIADRLMKWKNGLWLVDGQKMIDMEDTNEVKCGEPKEGKEWMNMGVDFKKLKIYNIGSEAKTKYGTKEKKAVDPETMIKVQSMARYVPIMTVYEVIKNGDPKPIGSACFNETKFTVVTQYKTDTILALKSAKNRYATSNTRRKAKVALFGEQEGPSA